MVGYLMLDTLLTLGTSGAAKDAFRSGFWVQNFSCLPCPHEGQFPGIQITSLQIRDGHPRRGRRHSAVNWTRVGEAPVGLCVPGGVGSCPPVPRLSVRSLVPLRIRPIDRRIVATVPYLHCISNGGFTYALRMKTRPIEHGICFWRKKPRAHLIIPRPNNESRIVRARVNRTAN